MESLRNYIRFLTLVLLVFPHNQMIVDQPDTLLEILALNDVLRNDVPEWLSNIVFHRPAEDAWTDAYQNDIVNAVVGGMNKTLTVSIQTHVQNPWLHPSDVFNIIIIDDPHDFG